MTDTASKYAECADLVNKLYEQRAVPEVHDAIAKCEAAKVRARAAVAALAVLEKFGRNLAEEDSMARVAADCGLYKEPLFGANDMHEEVCTSTEPRNWILAGTAFLIADATQNATKFFDASPWQAAEGFHRAIEMCLRVCRANDRLADAMRVFLMVAKEDGEEGDDSSESYDPRRAFHFWDELEVLFEMTQLGRKLKEHVVSAVDSTPYTFADTVPVEDFAEKHVWPLLRQHVAFRCFL